MYSIRYLETKENNGLLTKEEKAVLERYYNITDTILEQMSKIKKHGTILNCSDTIILDFDTFAFLESIVNEVSFRDGNYFDRYLSRFNLRVLPVQRADKDIPIIHVVFNVT